MATSEKAAVTNNDDESKDTSNDIPDTVEVLQSKAMDQLFYMIRNKETSHDDYVFYANRICRMLAEEGLARINDNKSETIETPCGSWTGIKPLDVKQLCVVSILRSGDILCDAVLQICRGISVGKILVQRDESSKDKHCVHFYTKLPKHISTLKVLLVDPMLGTAGSSSAAMNILIKHGVKEENILFLNLLGCSEGLWVLKKAFPKLRIVTCGVEPYMNEHKYLVPGIGDFGDRYYNTE